VCLTAITLIPSYFQVITPRMNTSFSLKIGQGIKGANGYGIVEAETECDDNSWDAGSNIIYKIATPYNETYKRSFSLHCDLGKSTSDPLSILGAGRQIKKKTDGDIGIKIMGAMNAMCRYNPDRFYGFFKTAGGPIWVMNYAFGDHVKEIQRVMDSGSRDYRDVDKWFEENNVIDTYKMGQNYIFNEPVIQEIYNSIENDEMKETLKRIASGEQDQFTIIVREYNSPLPEDIPEGIYKTLTMSKMLYNKQLLSGKQIVYLNPENELHTITAENAISPLGDVSQFARVLCKVGVYELQDGVCFNITLHTEDSSGTSADSKQFCITDSQQLINNKSFKVKLITTDVVVPSNAIYRGDINLSTSCISQTAQDEQTNELADADLGTRDSLRGVYCDYNRILGLPFWNTGKDTWGAVRNAGGIRAVMSFTSQWIAENIVCILSEKQRTNLTNAHPTLKKLFDAVVKTIIKNYSDYNKRTSTSGVKEWDLNVLYSQMTGIPLPKPAATPAAPQPAVPTPRRRPQPSIPDDYESISDASSVTSMDTASSSDVEPATRNITFELCTREIIVMNVGREVIRINNNGSGSGLRDWLIGTYDKLNNDDKFIKWIRTFGYINSQNSV
jgi:hypothetical protein